MKFKPGLLLVLCLSMLQAGSWASEPPVQTITLHAGGIEALPRFHSYASAFDIGLYFNQATERILSATITLNLVGAGQRVLTGSTSTTHTFSDSYGGGAWTDVTSLYDDEVDMAQVRLLHFGGPTVYSDDVENFYSSEVVTSTRDVHAYFESCQPVVGCTYWSSLVGVAKTADLTTGYKGPMPISYSLDAAGLDELSASGSLPYSFSVGLGSVALDSAQLVLVTTAVPEPATLGMGLLGLAALALKRARRSDMKTRA